MNFKLHTTTLTYWIDSLANIWDMFSLYKDQSNCEHLFFRSSQQVSYPNLSYLTQVIEMQNFSPQTLHLYSRAVVVLSVMYLVIRMRMQERK